MTISGISRIPDQVALVDKVNLSITEAPTDGATYGRNGLAGDWTAVPTVPGGTVANWVDIVGKPATFPPTLPIAESGVTNLVSDLAGKEPTITAGTTSQYWRGDKTWQTVNKAAVGLDQVDNTSDVNKPVSTAQTAAFVNVTGDSMTGNLTIAPAAASPIVFLTKTAASGQTSVLFGYRGATARWSIELGNTVNETGSNVGSNFAINNYNDAGTYLGSPIQIARITGDVLMPNSLNVSGTVYSGQNFISNGTAAIVSTTGAGAVYLYPNGVGSAVGRATVDYAGNLTLSNTGYLITPGRWQSTADVIIGATGGNSIYLRPHGVGNTTAQIYLDSVGVLHSTYFAPIPAVNGGFSCKDGSFNTMSGNYFNFEFDGVTLNAYVGGSQVGIIPNPSDYRLKKDIIDLPSTWDTVKALQPVKYTQAEFGPFVADDVERWGFIAHELQETLTQSAATGTKDMEGGVQSPNPWTIIAALTKTVQELQARVEALEAV